MVLGACDQIRNLIHRYSEAAGRATARYEDSFVLVDGAWRFSERVIRHTSLDGVHRDSIGDMSFHVRVAP